MYSNDEATCTEWFEGWIRWNGTRPENWLKRDLSKPFLLGTSWVNDWGDTDLYEVDYLTYQWVETDYYNSTIVSENSEWHTESLYSRNNLNVEISLSEVSSTVMVNPFGTLTMSIINNRSNITVNKFTQMTPTPDTNDELTNLFPLINGTTDQYLNETQEVELNSNTISNYAEGTLFRVKAEVQNDSGDKAISFISFTTDIKPKIWDATITCSSFRWLVLEDITIKLLLAAVRYQFIWNGIIYQNRAAGGKKIFSFDSLWTLGADWVYLQAARVLYRNKW